MRLLALEFGADIVYTEELIDWKMLQCKRKVNPVLGTVDFINEMDGDVVFRTCDKEKNHVVLQLGTASAERALKAAQLVQHDVAGIDINMGCPKEFSIKGGMGAALAANIDNAKKILTTLVSELTIPVTCKIRIKRTAEETIEHVKELEATGIAAIAIHARTRNERPQHKPHPGEWRNLTCCETLNNKRLSLLEIVKAVAEAVTIPVICNGGSKEIEKHSDIWKYKEACGASSIMIARAAEWNCSILRNEPMMELMDIIRKYLKVAVDYDAYPANAKYCIQNMLRDQQESELGRRFLDAQTLEQICEVFELKDYFKLRQAEFIRKGLQMRRDVVPKIDDDDNQPEAKKLKTDSDLIEENVTFIRANYINKNDELPKSVLHTFTKKKLRTVPTYETEQRGRLFRAVLTLKNKKYASTVWEKNKKFAEQGAALVASIHWGLVSKTALLENGSLPPI